MKYCSHCGKELLDEAVICVGCGCSVEVKTEAKKEIASQEVVLKTVEKETGGKLLFPIVAICLCLVSIILFLFVHTVVGIVILCVAAALTFVISIKTNKCLTALGIEKAKKRAIESKLRKNCKTLKVNFIATVLVGVTLILFGVGIGIKDAYKSSIPSEYANMNDGSYGAGLYQQIDEIKDIHDYANYVQNQRNILGY